jgi:hypothetical protein
MLSATEIRDLFADSKWAGERARKVVANALALRDTTEQIAAENKAIRAMCASSLVEFRMARDNKPRSI